MLLAALALILAPAASLADLRQRVERAPEDVSAFIVRRAGCNHFAGEDPYNRERKAELNRAIRKLRCTSVEVDERRLRQKYRGRPAFRRLLRETAELDGW